MFGMSTQYGGSQMQFPGTLATMCDYCHKKPKFPPYNYCSKVCGSKAKATAFGFARSSAFCKQCGMRPTFKGHQFCGKNCAATWQAMNGIDSGWYGPSQSQSQSQYASLQPGFNQGMQGMQGMPFGNGMQPNRQRQLPQLPQHSQSGLPPLPQQQYVQPNHSHMQPVPPNHSQMHHVTLAISQHPPMVSPPMNQMAPQMGGQMPQMPQRMNSMANHNHRMSQQYYSQNVPTSPGIQDPTAGSQVMVHQRSPSPPLLMQYVSSQDTGQGHNQIMPMGPPAYPTTASTPPSADRNIEPLTEMKSSMTSPNRGGGRPMSVHAQNQAQFAVQVTSSQTIPGGLGNGGWDQNDPNHLPQTQFAPGSTSSSLSLTCLLIGCNNPVFVDPITNQPAQYCSQRHREEAVLSGQANACIMCRKLPRGMNDRFCSKACRDEALRP